MGTRMSIYEQGLSPAPTNHIALSPLMPGQQAGRIGRRHSERCADLGGRGDTAIIQRVADRHAQAD